MKIPLVFEPRLEIDGERFVAQWRGRPENVRLGSFAVQAREVELRHLKQPDGAELPILRIRE